MVPDAFAPIVSRETFDQAQQIKNSRTIYKNNEQLLDTLRALWAKNGRLTQNLINRSTDVPSVHAFRTRFGSLRHAYQLIGYSGTHCSLRVTQIRRVLAGMKESLVEEAVRTFPEELSVERKSWRQRLRLRLKNGDLIGVHLCRGPWRHGDSKVWMLATDRDEVSKYSLVARMRENYDSFLDFHLMPCIWAQKHWLIEIDDYRLRAAIRFTKISELLAATNEASPSWNAQTFFESEMALLNKCMQWCAQLCLTVPTLLERRFNDSHARLPACGMSLRDVTCRLWKNVRLTTHRAKRIGYVLCRLIASGSR